MKKIFAVSHVCRKGIIGGFMYVTPERLIYQNGKVSIPKEPKGTAEYRNTDKRNFRR